MAAQKQKTVADPTLAYENTKPLWDRNRAVCEGEKAAKNFDSSIDTYTFRNLLIPFSPTMEQAQYDFYKAEAELPGISAQFAKMLVGGMLRKSPILELPPSVPVEAKDWLISGFGRDSATLTGFLDELLWEEIQTSRAWIFVDHPEVLNAEDLTKAELEQYKPYAVIQRAESVINWRVVINEFGRSVLKQVIVRGTTEEIVDNEFHPEARSTVWVHELNEAGNYQIRVFKNNNTNKDGKDTKGSYYELAEVKANILCNGEPLRFIPAWPLNGSIEPQTPSITPIVDKEIALYNKVSRRNHLLYGAATYTPVIFSDMNDDAFEEIVEGGLGTWLRLRSDDRAEVLKTPTEALADMDRAILQSIEEMARLGVRMLSPENVQSGVALEIRNAAQTAQLGTLATKASNTICHVISLMLKWRYGVDVAPTEVSFKLSEDFDPVPIGADWLRLATEWYQGGLIPRTVWLALLKQNDMIPPEYNDEEGQKEINDDDLIMPPAAEAMANSLNAAPTK